MKTLLGIIALTLVGCSNSANFTFPSACTGCLVAFGDSITYQPNGYAYIIAVGMNMGIDDQGVSSSRIEDDAQIGRIHRRVLDTTDIVVFFTGYNNVRGDGSDPVALANYKTVLIDAVQTFNASGAQTYIGTTMSFIPNDPDSLANNAPGGTVANSLLYANAIKDVIQQYGAANIHLVDINSEFFPSRTVIGTDFIHPNYIGHQEIADLMK